MRYADGQECRLGDIVLIVNGEKAEVVFCIDSNEYAPDFPKHRWEYLQTGAMVRTEADALVHFDDDNAHLLRLVGRRTGL